MEQIKFVNRGSTVALFPFLKRPWAPLYGSTWNLSVCFSPWPSSSVRTAGGLHFSTAWSSTVDTVRSKKYYLNQCQGGCYLTANYKRWKGRRGSWSFYLQLLGRFGKGGFHSWPRRERTPERKLPREERNLPGAGELGVRGTCLGRGSLGWCPPQGCFSYVPALIPAG